MSYHTASKFIEKMGYMFMTPHDQIRNNHTPEDAAEIINLMTNEKPDTITVSGYLGDKEVTKEEFAQEWIDHTKQLWRINCSLSWMDTVSALIEEVKKECDAEFELAYARQSEQSRTEPHITL